MPKPIIGVLVLLAFNLLGEIMSHFALPILPGSVVGMLLLFVALQLKLVKEVWIASLVHVIMKNLPLLFLAPAVGVITVFDLIKDNIWGILLTIIISTVCVIAAVGLTLNTFTKK